MHIVKLTEEEGIVTALVIFRCLISNILNRQGWCTFCDNFVTEKRAYYQLFAIKEKFSGSLKANNLTSRCK